MVPGRSLLFLAMQLGNEQRILELLNNREINVNVSNERKTTAFMWAVSKCGAKVVDKMMSFPELDVLVEKQEGYNAMSIALGKKDFSTAKKIFIFISNLEFDNLSENYKTLFMNSIQMFAQWYVMMPFDKQEDDEVGAAIFKIVDKLKSFSSKYLEKIQQIDILFAESKRPNSTVDLTAAIQLSETVK